MSNVALFADVGNLYHTIGKKYEGRKLDFEKVYSKAESYGKIQRAYAYGTQVREEATAFISCLEKIGYTTKYRKPKFVWAVGMALDVVRMISKVDVVVICSADRDLIPLLEWVRENGARCVLLGCGIGGELKDLADSTCEIEEEFLEEAA